MLGVQLVADGNMTAEFEFRRLQSQTWVAQVGDYKADISTQWINFTMVLLPRLSYSLMATTFTKTECKQILQPAICQLLPALGINHHFPRLMVYGHSNQFGLGVPHLYDLQGFNHLLALLKFSPLATTTGKFLLHSYEALQESWVCRANCSTMITTSGTR